MFISTMLKLIFFAVFVANFNYALSDATVSEATTSQSASVDTVIDDPSDERIRIRCGPNQDYVFCPLCPPPTCRNKDKLVKCISPLETNNVILCPRPRCQCTEGFWTTDDGKCVKKEECPPQCGRNQVYSLCATNPCLPTCEEPYLNTYCRPNPAVCKPGCICADGYVKDKNNTSCIPKENCQTQCKENEEHSSCPINVCRPKTCKDVGYSIACLETECDKPRCICKDGYVYNEEGVCIPTTECPTCAGDPNQVIGCGNYCERCNGTIACPRRCLPNTCDCRKGYVYNDIKMKCVLPTECPPKCGRNEVPSDCANNSCLPTCEQPNLDTYCKPNPANCKPGCVCGPGYLRNLSGVCVPKENCPIKCKENEEYSNCTSQVCRAQTCKELNYPPICLQSDQIKVKCYMPGCICQAGFVRNEEGICIPVRNCTQVLCPKAHDHLDLCPPDNCPPRTCDVGEVATLVACQSPSDPSKCKPSCVCDQGYFRNKEGECVTLAECSQCKENEEHSSCPINVCRPKTCKDVGYPIACSETECDKPRCICKDGYVYNEEGVCIPTTECPTCAGDPNQVIGCGNYCERCNGTIACPRRCLPNTCDCRKGYVYNDIKMKCVLPTECPPTCGRNEVPSDCANNSCLPTCEQPNLDTYCKPNPANCKPGCVCGPGYLRNLSGVCVPKENCPIKCKDNEEYSNYTSQVCRAQTCKELGYPLLCLQSDQTNVKYKTPGCICQAGFVRNEEGVCIPARNCTSCGGDPNAWTGCSNYCTRCTNYQNDARICLYDCHINGCDCRPGFVYNRENNKCVLPKECPEIKCGQNEVVSPCANSPCIRNCATKDMNIFCRPYPPGCETGCVCAEGYIRDSNRICIPTEKCPPSDIVYDGTLPVATTKS